MTKIVWDQGFKRSYRKRIANDQRLKESFWEAFEEFSRNPFSKKLRTHKLTGKLSGLWAFSVSYDCRVIFQFLSEDEVLLIEIGSHQEVY